MKRYRIPTHLTVEPSLIRAELGPIPVDLTFRQAMALAAAAGFAYWLWQGSRLPLWLVIPLALAALLLALTAAFVSIGGRSADLWLRDLLHYVARHPLRQPGTTFPGGQPSWAMSRRRSTSSSPT